MGFSVTSPSNASTLLAEIALSQGLGTVEAEETPPELIDSEEATDPTRQGFLRAEVKSYTFILLEGGGVSQTLVEYLNTIQYPQQQKLSDPKSGEYPLSFKENLISEKKFKLVETLKQEVDCNIPGRDKSFSKAHESAQTALAKAIPPPSAKQLRDTSASRQQQTQAKTLERKIHHAFNHREPSHFGSDSTRKNSEAKKQTKENDKEREIIQCRMDRSNKNEEQEEHHHKRSKDEEEGFSEGNRDRQQQNSHEDEKERNKIGKIEENFAKEFASYAVEESILSEIFQMKVSQFDVLLLFIEILKIDIRSREQEKLARRKERELQLLHMQNIVENYKTQGKWLMLSSLGAGIFSIVSGISPIAGHMKGPWILQKLGSIPFFSGLRDMDSNQFFKSVTKITMAMSEMQKSTGQIHQTFAEGNRTYDQHMSDIHRTDWEENTRSMEEIKDNWKGIENFLYQSLQMYHDSIRQLYSH